MNFEEAYDFIFNQLSGWDTIALQICTGEDDKSEGITLIKDKTNCSDEDANRIWEDYKLKYGAGVAESLNKAREQYQDEKMLEEYKNRNNAECPYCHSKNTKKISGLSKAGSAAMWGVFALGKMSKQWHCNNCKSDF